MPRIGPLATPSSRTPADLSADVAAPGRRNSGSAYRALVENAVFGILRSDRDGAFVHVNRALAEMLGYTTDDELLATLSARTIHVRASEYDRLVEQFSQHRPVRGFETEWRRKDGSALAVRLSGGPVYDPDGSFDGFELIVEDLSDRSRLEAQLRQAQKMEAIGQLTGGIAHDFNNLLTVILATADMLAEPVAERLPDYTADLDNLRGAAQRGTEMARKLLGFSRREQLAFELVDLRQVASNATMMLRPLLREHVEMRLHRDDTVGTVRADAGAVEQILMNLVANARDAMPGGGIVRIDVRQSWLDEDHRTRHGWGDVGEYAVIIVSDTGVGMDADTRQRLFEPFFTTKAAGAGTGLGMSMVFGLVKQHGGFIDVASEPGHGTVVKVFFPVVKGESVVTTVARDTTTPRGNELILVAEDQEAVQRSAKRVLEGLGYRVQVAGNGLEALDALRAADGAVDLVVTDVGMPKMTGPEFYRAARDEGITTPFLFTSAYSADDVRISEGLSSSLPFLHKPWTLTDFARRVRDVLDIAAARAELRDRSVLVVDDDSVTRRVLRTRLEEAGCVVTEAADAAAAADAYRAAPADVLVTDLAMPGQSGQELVAMLRSEFPDLRAVVISGALAGGTDAVLREAERLHVAGALPKPFTTVQLLDAVRRAAAGGGGAPASPPRAR